MKMSKPPAELIELFLDVAPDDPSVEPRKMFGQMGLFANGNMFAGVHEGAIVVRLPDERRAELLSVPGARPFEPMGRPMREYVCVPAAMHDDRAALRSWLAAALAYAKSLPVKEKKAKPKRPA
jgi:TfoX/Sxy family transcriptional regulator of competence genes